MTPQGQGILKMALSRQSVKSGITTHFDGKNVFSLKATRKRFCLEHQ
jgi:hypothetical protein